MEAPALYTISHTGVISDAVAVFRSLRRDPYVADGSRYKAIMRCVVHPGGEIQTTPHGDLDQSGAVSPAHGDLSRVYDAFELTPQMASLVRAFAHERRLTESDEILVQAQRIVAAPYKTAKPAVEGFLSDDVRALGIHCIARSNLVGGETVLLDIDTEEPVLRHVLLPGESLFADDARLLHNTLAIQGINPNLPAYRDVVLLGSPACRACQ